MFDQVECLLAFAGIAEIEGTQQAEILAGLLAGGFRALQPQPRMAHLALRFIDAGQVRHDHRGFRCGGMRLDQQRLGFIQPALVV